MNSVFAVISMIQREREREGKTETDRDRQIDRQTDRQTEKTIMVISTSRQISVFPKFPRTNFREQISETTSREQIFGNKFIIPSFERDKKEFSISFSKTGMGKS
jgi:hypothetical protein